MSKRDNPWLNKMSQIDRLSEAEVKKYEPIGTITIWASIFVSLVLNIAWFDGWLLFLFGLPFVFGLAVGASSLFSALLSLMLFAGKITTENQLLASILASVTLVLMALFILFR